MPDQEVSVRIHAMVTMGAACAASEVEHHVAACAEAGFDGVMVQALGSTGPVAGDVGSGARVLREAISAAAARGLTTWLDLSRAWAARESPEAFVAGALEPLRSQLGEEGLSCVEALWLGETGAGVEGPQFRSAAPYAPCPLGVSCGLSGPSDGIYLPEEVAAAMGERGLAVDESPRACLVGGDGERRRATRVAYREALAEHVASRVLGPVAAWCDASGVLLATSLEGEETPLLQVAAVGDALMAMGGVGLPSVQALGRARGNDLYPRLAASAAALAGGGRSACLALVGAGAGVGPEDVEGQLAWLASCGVTDMVLAAGAPHDPARPRGLPASVAEIVPWAPVLPSVLDAVRGGARGLGAADAPGPDVGDTLVVVPTRAIQETLVPADLALVDRRTGEGAPGSAAERISEEVLACVADAVAQGASPHLADESTLERHGVVRDCRLALGAARYQRVVAFPESLAFPAVAHLLTCLGASGCKVLTPEGWLASLGKQVTSFVGMPETLRLGVPAAPQRALPADPKPCGPVRPAQTPWRITPPGLNRIPLELAPQVSDGPSSDGLGASVRFSESLAEAGCRVVVGDCAAAAWDGEALVLEPAGTGRLSASLPPVACAEGDHLLSVTLADGRASLSSPAPCALLTGRFGVWSRLWPFDARHMTSAGGFELYRYGSLSELSGDLLESGYPFSPGPVTLVKTVELAEPTTCRIALESVRASAARVRVDGGEWLDAWGPAFKTSPVGLVAGAHELAVELFNSGYNAFGPHHHYLGDVPLVTASQYAGVRNFADPAHAPAHTRVDSWHFLRWGAGEDVSLEPVSE